MLEIIGTRCLSVKDRSLSSLWTNLLNFALILTLLEAGKALADGSCRVLGVCGDTADLRSFFCFLALCELLNDWLSVLFILIRRFEFLCSDVGCEELADELWLTSRFFLLKDDLNLITPDKDFDLILVKYAAFVASVSFT